MPESNLIEWLTTNCCSSWNLYQSWWSSWHWYSYNPNSKNQIQFHITVSCANVIWGAIKSKHNIINIHVLVLCNSIQFNSIHTQLILYMWLSFILTPTNMFYPFIQHIVLVRMIDLKNKLFILHIIIGQNNWSQQKTHHSTNNISQNDWSQQETHHSTNNISQNNWSEEQTHHSTNNISQNNLSQVQIHHPQ